MHQDTQENFQTTHKINIVAAWICAILFSGVAYYQHGLDSAFFFTVSTMAGACILITGLNWIPLKETRKGSILVCTLGLATLLPSIYQGGSDRGFLVSFLVLAMATLYFRASIILSYGIIYIGACIAAIIINPGYIDGPNFEMGRVLVKLIVYTALTAVLYMATRKGQRMVQASVKTASHLAESTRHIEAVSGRLFQSIPPPYPARPRK